MRLIRWLESLQYTTSRVGVVIGIIAFYAIAFLLLLAFGMTTAGSVGWAFLGIGIGILLAILISKRRCERCGARLAMKLADTKVVKRQQSVRHDGVSGASSVGVQMVTETWARTYRCRRCGAKMVREEQRTHDIG